MDIEEIGKIIKYHRKRAGLTQLELSDLAGIGKTVVFDIEKGKESVKWKTLKSVLDALNISIELSGPLLEVYYASMQNQRS